MKKLICIVMIMCLFPVVSLAEDLSSMSYEDLIALSQRIATEIMSRSEWKEVEVPPGTYEIGKDIPAGEYSIKCVDHNAIIEIKTANGGWTNKLYEVLSANEVLGKAMLPEGYLISISGNVIFAPPVLLGF